MPVPPTIRFHRTKYGPELLIDVAWVHDMPTFITDRPHALDFFDTMLVTRGSGTFTLDGDAHRVRPGVVFFTTPGQVRDWSVRGLDGVCFFFPTAFLDEFLRDPAFLDELPYFHIDARDASLQLSQAQAARLRSTLSRMASELRVLKRDSVHLLRARAYETLVTLARQYGAAHPSTKRRAINPIVARYRSLVERRVHEQHGVAFYAAELGLTPGHLNALCRRHASTSAKRIIDESLALRARRLLMYSDRAAADIGTSLGFDDPSYFNRFMKRVAGRSPSSFREPRAR
jgi:AraC-like DNA-binding protein